MRLSHQAMPYLRWSYFRSGRDDLMAIFPFVDGQDFGGELRDALGRRDPRALRPRTAVPPASRPRRADQPSWTEAYFDPAGAGWMVAYAAPVRADGRLVGVVGAAVLLDFLNGFMRASDKAGRDGSGW